jgi:hypothetical protein
MIMKQEFLHGEKELELSLLEKTHLILDSLER